MTSIYSKLRPPEESVITMDLQCMEHSNYLEGVEQSYGFSSALPISTAVRLVGPSWFQLGSLPSSLAVRCQLRAAVRFKGVN